ncbi:MAG: hypothetical protein BGO59_03285 [Spirosoma sp. 48-14]|nr:MAG: hypothetical protein BGO59_03285 [Spirosoma sp. 48-14]
MYGLGFVILMYACRNETSEPLKPFDTAALTKQLKDLQLPNLRATPPNAVSTTAGVITPSATANAVYNGIANNPTTSGAVSQAVIDMNNALAATSNTSTDINNSFTPQVLNTLATGGGLPTALQSKVDALTGNSNLQSYLPTYSYPTVNNQTVGPTTAAVTGPTPITVQVKAINIAPINYPSSGDPCFKAANDLFDDKIAGLSTDLSSQIATINQSYDQSKSAAEGERPSCVSDKVSQYANLIVAAQQGLNTNITNLNSAQGALGTANYNTLKSLIYVLYAYQIQLYYKVQTAEINVCAIKSTLMVAEAKVARDTDLITTITNYNATIQTAQKLVLELYDSCHNQGSAQ